MQASKNYRWYVLGVLVLVYIVNFIDRQILAILLPLIKADLGFSDTALGFLTGFAFAIFYVTLGFPAAWLADRGSRQRIISIAVLLWSAMTAATALANTFVQMALCRIGVGVGEAGCTPPAHSLISDYFPREERGTALGIYNLGFSFGVLIGFAAGGWVGETLGWRWAFFWAGMPGLLLSILVWTTVKEPVRRVAVQSPATDQPTLPDVLRFLLSQRAFVHLVIAASLTNLAYIGGLQWIPSFFNRSHGLSPAEVGIRLALVTGLVGGLGPLLGGVLTDYFGRRDMRWYVWLPGLGTVLATPFVVGAFLWPTSGGALLFLTVPASLGALGVAPLYAATRHLAHARMRAFAAASILFAINLVGLGFGPQLIGILSDILAPRYGIDSLRYALVAIMSIGTLYPALHFWLCARTLQADVERAERFV
mgnify:CR=1 FL=1